MICCAGSFRTQRCAVLRQSSAGTDSDGKKSTAPDARDAQIRNLKDALCLARRTTIDLMPEAFRAKLASLGPGTNG